MTSEVPTPADESSHINKHQLKVPLLRGPRPGRAPYRRRRHDSHQGEPGTEMVEVVRYSHVMSKPPDRPYPDGERGATKKMVCPSAA